MLHLPNQKGLHGRWSECFQNMSWEKSPLLWGSQSSRQPRARLTVVLGKIKELEEIPGRDFCPTLLQNGAVHRVLLWLELEWGWLRAYSAKAERGERAQTDGPGTQVHFILNRKYCCVVLGWISQHSSYFIGSHFQSSWDQMHCIYHIWTWAVISDWVAEHNSKAINSS